MSLARFPQGERSVLAGDFGEAWLEAVAAGHGHMHGKHSSLDLIKADVLLTFRGVLQSVSNPCVLVQVKTTDSLRQAGPTQWAYDLDVDTYNVMVRTNERVRRILVVIGLPKDGETVRQRPKGNMFVGRAAWVSLEGKAPSTNSARQVVHLPRHNRLDGKGLRTMLATYGVARSTPVPDVNEWSA